MADYVPERSQSNYPVERRREAAVPTRSRDDPYTLLVKVVAAGALLGIFGSFCHLGSKVTKASGRDLLPPTGEVSNELSRIYHDQILPLEEATHFKYFHSRPVGDAEFYAKPMVLVVGQYSVGKTSFIRSLVGKDFLGQRVGPEPTTDRFIVVTQGDVEQVVPGHALTMQANQPFRGLQQFGNSFLNKLEGSVVDAPNLRYLTLVDTPGVLSGQKQKINRDYDYPAAISWFAERADMIVVMFDAHKLDISDELTTAIATLRPHQDKMRILLNKADAIETQQLMRVYGALMWSLGKVLHTPEVPRVYIGSFWDAPLHNRDHKALLQKEKKDLLEELMSLQGNSAVRNINELAKRARTVKVHAYIILYLQEQMPTFFGKQQKKDELVQRLGEHFDLCARRYDLARGDFPQVEQFRRSLRDFGDLSKIKSVNAKQVRKMDIVFSSDIPELMKKAKLSLDITDPTRAQ